MFKELYHVKEDNSWNRLPEKLRREHHIWHRFREWVPGGYWVIASDEQADEMFYCNSPDEEDYWREEDYPSDDEVDFF